MTRLHLTAWLTVLALLVGFALYWRHEGAQAEKDKREIDSLSTANAVLVAANRGALATVDSQHQREALAAGKERAQEARLGALNGRLGALASILRDSLTRAQQAQLDSLEALHAQTDSLLASQRDSYRALFLGAAASRDTLAALLRASEAQIAGLQVALVKARHVPLWNTPAVKVVQLALALKGVASIFGH